MPTQVIEDMNENLNKISLLSRALMKADFPTLAEPC